MNSYFVLKNESAFVSMKKEAHNQEFTIRIVPFLFLFFSKKNTMEMVSFVSFL